MSNLHQKFMQRSIVLARRGIGKTAPNPAVGCVIVREGAIVGEGWHRKAGTPHAEVHALRQAGESARGADVYVSLEPCAHFGKTPPCAEALVAAGVKRVFAAMEDPNPRVSGRGIGILRAAGIEVAVGIMAAESRLLNEQFIKHVTTGLPFVVLKTAMTLDGKTATANGDSKWITSDKSRAYVHKLRGMLDAVMVGVGTVRVDDPLLTCRIPGGRDPLRVIVDSNLDIPIHSQVLHAGSRAGTIIATLAGDSVKADKLRGLGVRILQCRHNDGRVDLPQLFSDLGGMGVQSVLLEGGSTLAGECLRSGLIDKIILFYAPKLVGGEAPGLFGGAGSATMAEALKIHNVKLRRFGDDLLLEGYPEGPCLLG